MAEKLIPPTKSVGQKDGIKMGSERKTLTTPNPTFGRYFGSGKPASGVKGSGSIFGKK